jgi:hypothetical protein
MVKVIEKVNGFKYFETDGVLGIPFAYYYPAITYGILRNLKSTLFIPHWFSEVQEVHVIKSISLTTCHPKIISILCIIRSTILTVQLLSKKINCPSYKTLRDLNFYMY